MKHTDLDIMARKIRKTTIEMAYHAGAAGVHAVSYTHLTLPTT